MVGERAPLTPAWSSSQCPTIASASGTAAACSPASDSSPQASAQLTPAPPLFSGSKALSKPDSRRTAHRFLGLSANIRRAASCSMSRVSSLIAGLLVVGCVPSDGIPGENVARVVQREERGLHHGQRDFQAGVDGPALAAVRGADRARLREQVDLVAANAEDLPGHTDGFV